MNTSCLLNALENADNHESSGFLEGLESRLDLLSDLMILLNDERQCEAEVFDSESLREAMPVRERAEHDLIKQAHDYAREVDVWLDSSKPFLDAIDRVVEQEVQQGFSVESVADFFLASANALEEIAWDRILIQSKLFRSLSNRRREDLGMIRQNSDSNGSAKVALIGIERSRMAWTRISSGSSDLEKSITRLLNLLEKLEADIEQEFPEASFFRRPGFDSTEALDLQMPAAEHGRPTCD